MVRVLAALAIVVVAVVPGLAAGARSGSGAGCNITQPYSLGGTTPATIEFVNATSVTVSVYWLDFNGNRQLWFRLPAGRTQFQGTYIGHAWLVTDLAGTCIGFVVATQTSQRYVISSTVAPPQTTQQTTTTPAPRPKPKPKPAAPTIRALVVTPHPAAPTAGSNFTVTVQIVLTNGTHIGAANATCRATLAAVPLKGSGKGGCTFRIPKTAGAKRLAIVVAATYRGKAKSRIVVYSIRRAPSKPKPKRPPPESTTGTPGISTPAGRLLVDGVQITDRFPPGCILNTPICETPDPGYKVLIVWLKRAGGGDPGSIAERVADLSRSVYVTASNGTRTNSLSGGLLGGSLFVAFTPRAAASGFKLHWPGNPPIALGK